MKNPFAFTTGELVTIGLFAGASKAASLMVALIGGGPNPITLLLRNAVLAALMMVLLIKVTRPGTLTLSTVLSVLLGLFLLGSATLSFPGIIMACIIAEIFMVALAPLNRPVLSAAVGVAVSELLRRCVSLGMSYLTLREQPELLIPSIILMGFSYIGILVGVYGGYRMSKELRHAGLVQN